MSRKTYVHSNIRLEDLDPVLKSFLDCQTGRTKDFYGYILKKLLEFTGGQTGAQMLKDRKIWHRKIMEFHHWLKAQGYSDAYATTACAMVRGFFSSERKPLDLIRQEKLKLNSKERSEEDFLFSKEDVAKMAAIGSLKEKYVLFVGASFGLRAEDFAEIRYGHYRALDLNSDCPVPLGEMKTRKEKVKAYPFVSSDAVPIIKAYLEINRDKPDNAKVWNEKPPQLTTVLQSLFNKSGLKSYNKMVRFHNLRKYLIDRLSAVASESQWKQIVGKKISEGAYVSTDQLRDVYARAMPSIVINGNVETKKKVAELEKENEALKTRLTEAERDVEQGTKAIEESNRMLIELLTRMKRQEKKQAELEEQVKKAKKNG
jgi:hypothetical protein